MGMHCQELGEALQQAPFSAAQPQAHTLQDRMFPKAENVSYRALLSMESSRFLINTFPTPDFLSPGSLWDHMIRIGRPLITSKFMVSRARSAGKEVSTKRENGHRDGPPSPSYSTRDRHRNRGHCWAPR